MGNLGNLLLILTGFAIVGAASGTIAKVFQRIKLPLITGFLVVGIIAGPYVVGLIPKKSVHDLYFINHISLTFIAFAAGSELYLKDMRSRFKSIAWMTFGQLVVTFLASSIIIFYLADYIHFMATMSSAGKLAVAMLIATIFVARSPASAIAIINELRARGPFTQTAIGVTVVKDVLVIILFTFCFAISGMLINNVDFEILSIVILLFELIGSLLIGWLLGKCISLVLSIRLNHTIKSVLVLVMGWAIYGLEHHVKELSTMYFSYEIYLEPLLINIVASFYVTNNSKNRLEFLKLIDDTGIYIYIAFFTLTGASISIDILSNYWFLALVFFVIRLGTMILGSLFGGWAAGDPAVFRRIGWMPFVTQAGVGLGLITVIANAYPSWGIEFETILVTVVVLNQMVGPPLFKWSIYRVKENHDKAPTPKFDGVRDAIIFGFESQSLSLAKLLQENNWNVIIATLNPQLNPADYPNYRIEKIDSYSLVTFDRLEADKAEAIIGMQNDDENYKICQIAYEHFGTKDIIVRLNDHKNFNKFHELGVLIVDPRTSIVNLLFHFVRSPIATSILLGIEKGQDTVDIEVVNPDIAGLALRDLRLPSDVLVLSVNRGGNTVISHGYTRLRLGDVVTLLGSKESVELMRLKFE
jgi:Trk K+ transport system NAD-binding subunit/Kef-type K+ transport system membrane component KefB